MWQITDTHLDINCIDLAGPSRLQSITTGLFASYHIASESSAASVSDEGEHLY